MIEILKDYWWIFSTFILPLLTYLVGMYKKKNTTQDERIKELENNQRLRAEALKTLLQSELTKIFYKYKEKGEIPSYAYKNWINLFNAYKELGGNDYVHELHDRIREFKINSF